MASNKKIKLINDVINKKDESTLIRANKELTNNRERAIVFSFSNFKKESVRCKGFNNFYPTRLDAINAAKDFFESISILSKHTPSELSEFALKEQFHYNKLDDNLEVSRIENVLINGYGINAEK